MTEGQLSINDIGSEVARILHLQKGDVISVQTSKYEPNKVQVVVERGEMPDD